MILRREYLSRHSRVFRSMTGIPVALFEQLLPDPGLAGKLARQGIAALGDLASVKKVYCLLP